MYSEDVVNQQIIVQTPIILEVRKATYNSYILEPIYLKNVLYCLLYIHICDIRIRNFHSAGYYIRTS